LSGNKMDGSVIYVCKPQLGDGGRIEVDLNLRSREGWRPVGLISEAWYWVPESPVDGWWRDGNEKKVGSEGMCMLVQAQARNRGG
jgi:hypothetical protein